MLEISSHGTSRLYHSVRSLPRDITYTDFPAVTIFRYLLMIATIKMWKGSTSRDMKMRIWTHHAHGAVSGSY